MVKPLIAERRILTGANAQRESAFEPRSSTPHPRIPAFVLYAINVFLSAFLLFQVELMMAKFVLPRYGGGSSVWSTALLVFQVLLLGGYAYAALICTKLPPKRQATAHLWLIGVCAFLLILQALLWRTPLFPRVSWLSGGSEYPISQISALLLVGAGLPCMLLSAHSPLCQNWFSNRSQASPYRLYAVSNLGSLLGLISYPFLVEPAVTLTRQAWLWSGLFTLVLVFSAACALLRMREPVGANGSNPGAKRKTAKKVKALAVREPRLLWLALAGCSSTILLAMTNIISQQVAPVPLLWVVPLSLYLLSFVICFDHPRWYRREIFSPLYVLFAYLTLAALPRYADAPANQLLAVLCLTLFVVCMICHGELARAKPPAEQLTSFYLTVAAGGALGSAFVALVAPRIFDRFWECYVALLGCGGLLVFAILRDPRSWARRTRYGVAVVATVAVLLGTGAIYLTNMLLEREQGALVLERTRNFFGIKAILKEGTTIDLVHGRTLHGMQSVLAGSRNEPLMYYGRETGVGRLLDQIPRTPDHPNLRVGVVGMGAGSLAAYGQPGDYYRFYEIDPAVPRFSSGSDPYFTFVRSSAAKVDVVEGDGRIRLQQESSRGEQHDFDVLVVDAFSGDSIPVHLLTREAMELYLRRIRGPQSVIAFHVSNSALNLRPVMESLARTYQLASVEVDTPANVHPTWVLLSRDPAALHPPNLVAEGKELKTTRKIAPWTDDYSSLYQLFLK